MVLAFGRCQMLDKLPQDFRIPVLYPPGEDCIGVLLGQERYLEELYREAGTWFLPPGWAELGMAFYLQRNSGRRTGKTEHRPNDRGPQDVEGL